MQTVPARSRFSEGNGRKACKSFSECFDIEKMSEEI